MADDRCPSCNSPQDYMYPATSEGGEATFCADSWHARSERGREVQENFRDLEFGSRGSR